MALGCSVANNRAGAYVGPISQITELTPYRLNSYLGFPVVTTIPHRTIKYLPANLHITVRLIRFKLIEIFVAAGGGGRIVDWEGCSNY